MPDARKILTKAAKIDELHVQKVDEAMVVGNVRGLDLAKLANLAHPPLGRRAHWAKRRNGLSRGGNGYSKGGRGCSKGGTGPS